jgi:prepilin-type processing-associated H-X9-DG protein
LTERDRYEGMVCALGPTSYAYLAWVTQQDEANCTDDLGLRDSEIFVTRIMVAGMVSSVGWNPFSIHDDIPWSSSAFNPIGLSASDQLCWGSGNSNVSLRMREGIERFMITDINQPAASAVAQSEIPVMIDMMSAPHPTTGLLPPVPGGLPPGGNLMRFNHLPGGINCLYMDGHVRFIRYGEKYPASQGAAFFVGGAASWASAGEDLWRAYAVAPAGPF